MVGRSRAPRSRRSWSGSDAPDGAGRSASALWSALAHTNTCLQSRPSPQPDDGAERLSALPPQSSLSRSVRRCLSVRSLSGPGPLGEWRRFAQPTAIHCPTPPSSLLFPPSPLLFPPSPLLSPNRNPLSHSFLLPPFSSFLPPPSSLLFPPFSLLSPNRNLLSTLRRSSPLLMKVGEETPTICVVAPLTSSRYSVHSRSVDVIL